EQRRTSLRHAGAIEFMAPEQNNGEILFQTDVYSFGVILFELLAGTVPFPLNERGETARTQVMLAHMETPPPDLMELRRKNLPAHWNEEKKARELQVPRWLIDTVYICLQKPPQSRFADGTVLHDHIVLRSTQKPGASEVFVAAPAGNPALENELRQLRQENEELRRRVQSLQATAAEATPTDYVPQHAAPRRRSNAGLVSTLLVLAVLGVAAWLVIKKPGIGNQNNASPATETTGTVEDAATLVAGQYMVKAARAYFYDHPDPASRRNAYMVPSSDVVNTTKEANGYVYTDFVNSRGQRSKGWLRVRDLVTLDQWNEQKRKQEEAKLTQEEIDRQLTEAR
ncbi:MAG: serine/threonine protein kinase, partial [Chitinophagaceae bacterium]